MEDLNRLNAAKAALLDLFYAETLTEHYNEYRCGAGEFIQDIVDQYETILKNKGANASETVNVSKHERGEYC